MRRRRDTEGDSPTAVAGGRSGARIPCPHCRRLFKRNGFAHHEVRCREDAEVARRDQEILAALEGEGRSRKKRRKRRSSTPPPAVPSLHVSVGPSTSAGVVHPSDLSAALGSITDPSPPPTEDSTEAPTGYEPQGDIASSSDMAWSDAEQAHRELEAADATSKLSDDLRSQSPSDAACASSPSLCTSRPPSVHDTSSAAPPLWLPEEVSDDLSDRQIDDIRVEYHPNSGRGTKIFRFDDYARERPFARARQDPLREKPWEPFKSLDDFNFAELALDANLKKDQVELLLSLINRGKESPTVSFGSFEDIQRIWEKAAVFYPTFTKQTFSLKYKNSQEESFDVHVRNVWEWITTVVEEPSLAPHFQWDAQRMSKWDGAEWVPYYDDPCTGGSMWNAQSNLPEPDGKPLGIILFADKSKISSFGTQKGYPVIARIANLDTEIRNGKGFGGGRIVGFLPVVSDPPTEHGKTEWVDFKRVVWHEGFKRVLESVQLLSKVGFSVLCGDQLQRKLYPFIVILSADYEEQCVMALIRGHMGKCPCPICLVPNTELSDLTKTWPERDPNKVRAIITKVAQLPSEKENTEKILQAQGLRPIESCFWDLLNSDPYKALSFDRLHAYHLGLFGDHLWDQFKKIIKKLPRSAAANVDKGAADMPRWRNFNHFNEIMLLDFSDGNKFQDISKIVPFAACNILTRKASPAGYALMKLIRKYLECDMYAGFEVHTEKTLDKLDILIAEFGYLIKEYEKEAVKLFVKPKDKIKNWDFPKIHTHMHATRDIRLKGALHHMSTRLFEHFHGPIRKWVQLRTNNKDIWDQVADGEQKMFCSIAIRDRISSWKDDLKDLEEEEPAKSQTSKQYTFGQISLGSLQPKTTLKEITAFAQNDIAFENFHSKLNLMASQVMTMISQKPTRLEFPLNTDVTEARYVKVDFESLVTWRQERDYLRCSPSFHGQPRHDSIIFHDTEDIYTFARLVFIFSVMLPDKSLLPMALVQPFDRTDKRTIDRDLGLYPLRIRDRSQCRIIPLRSVKRGAVLYKDSDPKRPKHYFVVDIIDSDMFLRLTEMY